MYTITEKVPKTNEKILQLNEGIPWSKYTTHPLREFVEPLLIELSEDWEQEYNGNH